MEYVRTKNLVIQLQKNALLVTFLAINVLEQVKEIAFNVLNLMNSKILKIITIAKSVLHFLMEMLQLDIVYLVITAVLFVMVLHKTTVLLVKEENIFKMVILVYQFVL